LLLCTICVGQDPAPRTVSAIPHKEILSNQRVTVSLMELAPGVATPMHQHDRDMLSVYVSGGRTRNTQFSRKSAADKTEPGQVRFRPAGYSHAVENVGKEPYRLVMVEFADPQGKIKNIGTSSHRCNPEKSTACIDEKNLFCTAKVCVQDVVMAPGAATSEHSHATDHMIVAISDFEMTDEAEGKKPSARNYKNGEVTYVAAGLKHRLTNTGKTPAHFTVIVWR
jgi:quercetin dioxygenase-like cupin family protein